MINVLITGASGMLGMALQKALAQNPNILLFTPTRQDVNWLDKTASLAYFEKTKPDFVYHLAAKVGGIAANVADPVGFFYDNMQINLNVMHAAHVSGTPRLVYVGSSCMYPRNREILREEDLLSGELEPTNEGYAIAKLAGMLFCKYLGNQFALHYKTIIPCNLYGEHDHFDPERSHLIPAVIRKIHEAKTKNQPHVVIWGDGLARREFMHVADLVQGLTQALEKYDSMPKVMNMGLGYDYTINAYYEIAARIIGYSGQFQHDLTKPAGMQKKLVDISKAKAWGWSPVIRIEEGIERVYHHVLKHKILE